MSELSTEELSCLNSKLKELEAQAIRDNMIGNQSGGFARAELISYDDEYIDVELRWGVQSDCRDNVHVEGCLIDRETWEVVGD